MRRALLIVLLLWSRAVFAQDSINPHVLSLPCNILIQQSDVYYDPFAPPASTDTREALCNLANALTDPNGVASRYPAYCPVTHGMRMGDWAPHGTPIGWNTTWQRLFTARSRPGGIPSDIVAGATITKSVQPVLEVRVSANEDVDFRASGTVRLEHGFHVMPGAFFHAYQEPKWGNAVLSDDFNGSIIDRSQWQVQNGHDGAGHNQCSFDTNVSIVADPDAVGGHALDIAMREDPCNCRRIVQSYTDHCQPLQSADTISVHRAFSSAIIHSCPWPFLDRNGPVPLTMAYQHMPYGKYEIREKIPHFYHHTNNWFFGSADYELDLSEGMPGWQGRTVLTPSLHYRMRHGPFRGHFVLTPADTTFVSEEPRWRESNVPTSIVINNFAYNVSLKDSAAVVANNDPRCWPRSLIDSLGPFTFYYTRSDANTADKLHWQASKDRHGQWRIIDAPYQVDRAGKLLRFSKSYQPTSIAIDTDGYGHRKSFACVWDSALNSPDTSRGLLLLTNDSLRSSDIHSKTEAFSYSGIREGIFDYPGPGFALDWNDSNSASYLYHTFAVEVLPTEIRFLYDSNVVRRLPDRLIPPNDPQSELPRQLPRSGGNLFLGEFDIDNNSDIHDPLGIDASVDKDGNFTSITHLERVSFERASDYTSAHPQTPWAGFELQNGSVTAHHKIDYVRVWDIPESITVLPFPR